VPTLQSALAYLAHDADYLTNVINTRINAPSDVNYSDDELTMFSYLPLFQVCGGNAELGGYAWESLLRTWTTAIQPLRSNLWGGIYVVIAQTLAKRCNLTAPPVLPPEDIAAIAADVVWNLRTWSSDPVSWPVSNSHRLDVFTDPYADRFGVSDDLLEVLPQWERCQGRWNANPYQVDGCGGDSISDPGVWLMPYWLARWAGLLSG